MSDRVASYPWMRTSCKTETKACGHVSIRFEEFPKHNDGVQKHPLFRGFGDVAASKRVRKNSGGFTLLGSPKKLRKGNWEGQSFPVFNVAVESRLAKQNSTINRRLLSENNTSPMLGWPSEAIPPLKERQVKFHNFLEDSSSAVSKSFQDRPMRLDSKLTMHQVKCGSTCMPLFDFKDKEPGSMSGIGLFPNQSTSSEVPRHEKAYAICNTQTMNICAAVDAEKESSRCLPQTTPFPKNTGFNLSEGRHMFGGTTVSTKLKGQAFCEPLVSPEHSFPVKTGFKLLPYRSATHSEEEDVKGHANNLDHESSSETDTMDMDGFQFQDNFLLGAASSPPNEHTQRGQKSPTSRSAFTSAREEIRGSPPFTKLPDINQELPKLAAYASLADEGETSTSRTQSLDVKHLLAHAEQPTDSKSSASADGPQRLDLNFRWVERLNLSASHFAYGTKSKKLEEASSPEKVNALHKKNMKCSVTNSQPAMGRFHGRKQMALDDTPMLLRNGDLSSSDPARTSSEGENIPLSHPWIRRWSHKVFAPNNKSEAAVVSQPQSPRETFDQFQKKQFPSIAAMALMGKAMNGLNPCEFANKGSLVVWNTKEF